MVHMRLTQRLGVGGCVGVLLVGWLAWARLIVATPSLLRPALPPVLLARRLLRPGGVYSFFNGLAPDNMFFHLVYGEIARLELGRLGLETTYEPVPMDASGAPPPVALAMCTSFCVCLVELCA